jgi:hypothetical protein
MSSKDSNSPLTSGKLKKSAKTLNTESPSCCTHEQISEKRTDVKNIQQQKSKTNLELSEWPGEWTEKRVEGGRPKTDDWAYLQLQLGLAHSITVTALSPDRFVRIYCKLPVPTGRVVDPDPDWIRIQRLCGSGSRGKKTKKFH